MPSVTSRDEQCTLLVQCRGTLTNTFQWYRPSLINTENQHDIISSRTASQSKFEQMASNSTANTPSTLLAGMSSASLRPDAQTQSLVYNENNMGSSDHTGSLATAAVTQAKPIVTPTTDPLVSLPHSTSYETDGSRFYIKKRIVVGNISQFIPPRKPYSMLSLAAMCSKCNITF